MRKLVIGAVAGLSLWAVGCKNGQQEVAEQRREVAEAQREAGQDVAKARNDAQRDLVETQRENSQELAEVQQDAQRKIAGEQKDVVEAQRDQNEALRQDDAIGGSGMAGAATTVMGKVDSTLGSQLKLKLDNGQSLELATDDRTIVTHNKQRVELDDFKEGTSVRASYVTDGDEKIARQVDIVTPVKK